MNPEPKSFRCGVRDGGGKEGGREGRREGEMEGGRERDNNEKSKKIID